jgi:hypothetical protein
VTLKAKGTLKFLAAPLLVLTGLAALAWRMMPPPHRPLEYMIAGTAATAVALAVAFAVVHFSSRQSAPGTD